MREELERGGCTFHWGARAVDLEVRDGRVRGLVLADGRTLPCDRLVLAPGNSARELYELFAARGWPIEAKPFAVGFRVEHPQALIDRIQYGPAARAPGPAARRLPAGREPARGREARAASSPSACARAAWWCPPRPSPACMCTNGMSNSTASLAARQRRARGGGVARPTSPPRGFAGPLAGLAWQRKWERAAFALGGGGYRAPAQRRHGLAGGQGRRSPRGAPPTGPASPTPTCGASTRPTSSEALARRGCAASTGACAASSRRRRLLIGRRDPHQRALPAGPRTSDIQVARPGRRSTRPARAPATRAGSSPRRWTA